MPAGMSLDVEVSNEFLQRCKVVKEIGFQMQDEGLLNN
jgi:hypothetical protein